MNEKNITLNKSFDFSVRVVKLYKYLSNEKTGQTKKDFIAKMSIASKEARETKYWLDLLIATDYLSDQDEHTKSLLFEIHELIKLLTSIVKTSQVKEI